MGQVTGSVYKPFYHFFSSHFLSLFLSSSLALSRSAPPPLTLALLILLFQTVSPSPSPLAVAVLQISTIGTVSRLDTEMVDRLLVM
ncbi:hypothetical protein ACS0TY_005884 [Phlomoides rotata]